MSQPIDQFEMQAQLSLYVLIKSRLYADRAFCSRVKILKFEARSKLSSCFKPFSRFKTSEQLLATSLSLSRLTNCELLLYSSLIIFRVVHYKV